MPIVACASWVWGYLGQWWWSSQARPFDSTVNGKWLFSGTRRVGYAGRPSFLPKRKRKRRGKHHSNSCSAVISDRLLILFNLHQPHNHPRSILINYSLLRNSFHCFDLFLEFDGNFVNRKKDIYNPGLKRDSTEFKLYSSLVLSSPTLRSPSWNSDHVTLRIWFDR